MKKALLAIVLASLAPMANAADNATTNSSNSVVTMDPFRVTASKPVPVHILQPRVQSKFAGQKLELEFRVDQSGRAYDFDSSTPVDRDLVTQLADAISGWRFNPARDSAGNPVDRKVVLPVNVIDNA